MLTRAALIGSTDTGIPIQGAAIVMIDARSLRPPDKAITDKTGSQVDSLSDDQDSCRFDVRLKPLPEPATARPCEAAEDKKAP